MSVTDTCILSLDYVINKDVYAVTTITVTSTTIPSPTATAAETVTVPALVTIMADIATMVALFLWGAVLAEIVLKAGAGDVRTVFISWGWVDNIVMGDRRLLTWWRLLWQC